MAITPTLGWIVLYVNDVTASAAMYEAAFGLDVAFAHPDGDYTEFATGTTALALCATSLAEKSTATPLAERGAPGGNITLVVDDVAAAFERAVAAGCWARVAPATKPWGQVSSYVADVDGNLIELASPVDR